MALIPTPVLQAQLQAIGYEYMKTLFSGDGIDEGNMYSDPDVRNLRANSKWASDTAKAIEAYIEAIVFTAPPGLPTAGAPTAHVSTAPWIITKT